MADVLRLDPPPPREVDAAMRVLAESGRVTEIGRPQCRSTRNGLVWTVTGRLPGHDGVHSFALARLPA